MQMNEFLHFPGAIWNFTLLVLIPRHHLPAYGGLGASGGVRLPETEAQSAWQRAGAAERERSDRSSPFLRRRHARGGGGAGLPPVRCWGGRR